MSEFLVGQGRDILILRERFRGKGPEYALADAGVETRLTEKVGLQEVMEEFLAQGYQRRRK